MALRIIALLSTLASINAVRVRELQDGANIGNYLRPTNENTIEDNPEILLEAMNKVTKNLQDNHAPTKLVNHVLSAMMAPVKDRMGETGNAATKDLASQMDKASDTRAPVDEDSITADDSSAPDRDQESYQQDEPEVVEANKKSKEFQEDNLAGWGVDDQALLVQANKVCTKDAENFCESGIESGSLSCLSKTQKRFQNFQKGVSQECQDAFKQVLPAVCSRKFNNQEELCSDFRALADNLGMKADAIIRAGRVARSEKREGGGFRVQSEGTKHLGAQFDPDRRGTSASTSWQPNWNLFMPGLVIAVGMVAAWYSFSEMDKKEFIKRLVPIEESL